jgi:hypothetical protein
MNLQVDSKEILDNLSVDYIRESALKSLKADESAYYDYSAYTENQEGDIREKININICDIQDPAIKYLFYSHFESMYHLSADYMQNKSGFNPKDQAGAEAILTYMHHFSTIADSIEENLKLDSINREIRKLSFATHEMILNYEMNKHWEEEHPDAGMGEPRYDVRGERIPSPAEGRKKASEEMLDLVAEYMSLKYGVTAKVEFDGLYLASSYYIEEVRAKTLYGALPTTEQSRTYDEFRRGNYEKNKEELGQDFADMLESQIEEGMMFSERTTTNIIQSLINIKQVNQDGEERNSVAEVALDLDSGAIKMGDVIIDNRFDMSGDELSLIGTKYSLKIPEEGEEGETVKRIEIPVEEIQGGKLFVEKKEDLDYILETQQKLFSAEELHYPVAGEKVDAQAIMDDEPPSKSKKKNKRPKI